MVVAAPPIVSGTGVPKAPVACVKKTLEAAGVRCVLASLDDREASKRLSTVEKISSTLLEQGLDRHSLLIGVGGGLTCDLAGFVAATFMRGIPHALIPTTLLAMVDAAIGGKTGVNLSQAKNAIGCFKQPLAVLIRPAFLDTLPPRELLNGFAEAVKHGVIADPELLAFMDRHAEKLLALDESLLAEFIARNARIKAGIVSLDPSEQGPRKALNFGHTLGHALEAEAGFKGLSHGEAVAIGMVFEARLSQRLGGLSAVEAASLEHLLEKLGLSTRLPALDSGKLLARMAFDKKNEAGTIRFALPQAIGRMMDPDGSYSVPVPVHVLRSLLEARP